MMKIESFNAAVIAAYPAASTKVIDCTLLHTQMAKKHDTRIAVSKRASVSSIRILL